MKMRTSALMLAAVAVIACSSTGGPRMGDSNVLTRAELAAGDQQDLYRLIEALRPQWFNSHGPSSFSGFSGGGPTVFMEGARMGAIGVLRNMPPADVEEIRYWPAAEAIRFGMDNPDGVIDIKRRR